MTLRLTPLPGGFIQADWDPVPGATYDLCSADAPDGVKNGVGLTTTSSLRGPFAPGRQLTYWVVAHLPTLVTDAVTVTAVATVPPPTPPPAPTPAGPSLDGWKLTLPTTSASGSAASVNPAATTPPWLTQDADGALVFWAPVGGTTTPNSQHTRTELDALTGWQAGTSGPHVLSATLHVDQIPPATGKVIVGQIHGADTISSVSFVLLYYVAGSLYVNVKTDAVKNSSPTKLVFDQLPNIPLGETWSYRIADLGDGSLAVTATYGNATQTVTAAVSTAFQSQPVRFQAGAYQQDDSAGSTSTTDGARVTFTALNAN